MKSGDERQRRDEAGRSQSDAAIDEVKAISRHQGSRKWVT